MNIPFLRVYQFSLLKCMPKFVLLVIKSVPVTVEIYLHRGFGERYMWRLIGAVALFYCYAIPSFKLVPVGTRPLLSPFFFGMVILSVVHFFHLPFRRRRGQIIASYSSGSSWPIWQRRTSLSPTTVRRYAEPALVMAVAFMLDWIDRDLASWLYFSGIGLFIKEQLARLAEHRNLVDAFDGRIESERQRSAAENFQSPQGGNQGFNEVHPEQR